MGFVSELDRGGKGGFIFWGIEGKGGGGGGNARMAD